MKDFSCLRKVQILQACCEVDEKVEFCLFAAVNFNLIFVTEEII